MKFKIKKDEIEIRQRPRTEQRRETTWSNCPVTFQRREKKGDRLKRKGENYPRYTLKRKMKSSN